MFEESCPWLKSPPTSQWTPKFAFGKPVITGTRVPVDLVVGKVAGGMSVQEVAEAYDLAKEDVQAALSYAAQVLANERIRLTK